MKCNIKIMWLDIFARDALFEALTPHTKKFSVSTEVDDGVYWLGADAVQEKISVNVYAASLGRDNDAVADRIAELYLTRNVRYVALDTRSVDQDVYHSWLEKLQARLPDPIYVFDPTVGGPYFDQLIQDMNDGITRIPERTLPSAADPGDSNGEEHW